MSLDATRWAWLQKVTPTQKLVLLSLADRADESHKCYPSNARLQSDTGLYRETIYEVIEGLEAAGIIQVTRKIGSGNRYQLIGVSGREEPVGESRLVGKSRPVGESRPHQSGKADYHQSGKADTESTNESTKKQKQYAPPIDGALLSAWKEVRKAKRSGPLTEIAWAGLVREAAKAGISPEDAVRECVERGWQSLKAEWIVKPEDKPEAKGKGQPWWASEKGIEAKGREIGLFPRGGETWNDFKGRINAKLGEVSYG